MVVMNNTYKVILILHNQHHHLSKDNLQQILWIKVRQYSKDLHQQIKILMLIICIWLKAKIKLNQIFSQNNIKNKQNIY